MEKVRYMISDAATMAGVESHVLRYWEDELELTIPRNEMGHRYYTRENIQEFQKIKELKEQGYQLKAIRMILHNGGIIPQGMAADGTQIPLTTAAPISERQKPAPAISIVPHPSAAAAAVAANKPQASGFSAVTSQSAAVNKTQHQEFTVAPQPAASAGMPTPPEYGASALQQTATAGLQGAEFAVAAPQQTAAAPINAAQPAPLSAEERMAQFRELMSDIVGHAIAQNNEELSLNISQEVKETILKEMNYLFREQEEAQEDRYKKLDAAIRGNLQRKKSLFAAKDKPPKEKKEKLRKADKKALDKKTVST